MMPTDTARVPDLQTLFDYLSSAGPTGAPQPAPVSGLPEYFDQTIRPQAATTKNYQKQGGNSDGASGLAKVFGGGF